jgi:hypothetical protein
MSEKLFLRGVPPRQGKTVFGPGRYDKSVDCNEILTNEEKREILIKAFEAVVSPKCPDCGAKLSPYPFYDWNGEKVNFCPKCKREVRRK